MPNPTGRHNSEPVHPDPILTPYFIYIQLTVTSELLLDLARDNLLLLPSSYSILHVITFEVFPTKAYILI